MAYEFKWHPFPKETPSEDGVYLVTYNRQGRACVFTAQFLDYSGEDSEYPYYWEDEYSKIDENFITAWAELPMPYYARPNRKKGGK